MRIQRRETALYAQAAWMGATLVGTVALDSFSLDLYVAASLVGLLVVWQSTVATPDTRRWRHRLTVVVVLGLLGFGGIVLSRVLDAAAVVVV